MTTAVEVVVDVDGCIGGGSGDSYWLGENTEMIDKILTATVGI